MVHNMLLYRSSIKIITIITMIFTLTFLQAENSRAVEPEISINNSNESAVLTAGEPVLITISLDPGELEGEQADWWILIESPFGWYSFVFPDNWQAGIIKTSSLSVFYLNSFELPIPQLPEGQYTLYFGLEAVEGELSGTVWVDVKTLTINPALPDQSSPLACPEMVQLTPGDTDKITIAWLPYTDNEAQQDQAVYEVHVSTQENFTPSSTTLYSTVGDELQMEITGLTQDTLYYVMVLAKDIQGNLSSGCDASAVSTFSLPVILNNAVPINQAKDFGLDEPEIDGDIYTYKNAENNNAPETGSLLMGESGYLRKVQLVTRSGSDMIIQTTEASLSEGVSQANIKNTMKLFAVADKNRSSNNSAFSSRISTSKSGTRHTRKQWKNNFLIAEQKDYATNKDEMQIMPGEETGLYSIKINKTSSTESEASFETSVNFTPELITDIRWEEGEYGQKQLQKAEIIARGTLSLDVEAMYRFSASANYEKEISLFERTYTSVYSAGPVPVYQEISMSVDAVISAEANSALNAGAQAHAGTTVELGLRYNTQQNSWETVASKNFSKSLTAQLNIKGEVVGEIRLIPQITIKFYKTVSAGLSIEPYLKGTIGVESITDADILGSSVTSTTQIKNFDFVLGVEGFAQASLDILFADITIFGKTRIIGPPPNTDWEIYLPEYTLFDLPRFELTGNANAVAGQPLTLTLVVDDGSNNPFDPESLRWEFLPVDGSSKINIVNQKRTTSGQYRVEAQLTACSQGDHTVFVSGYGSLGEIARRYTSLPIKVEQGECKLTADFTTDPDRGFQPLSVNLDGGSSFDPNDNIVQYQWVVSDGQKTDGKLAQVILSEAGNYEITLTVENAEGETASTTKNVIVKNCDYYHYIASDQKPDDEAYYVDCIWIGDDNFYHYEQISYSADKIPLSHMDILHKLDKEYDNITYNDLRCYNTYWGIDRDWYSDGTPKTMFQNISGYSCLDNENLKIAQQEMEKHVDTYGYPTAALWASNGGVLQYMEFKFDNESEERPGIWQWNCNWSFNDNDDVPVGSAIMIGADGYSTNALPSTSCWFTPGGMNCCPAKQEYCVPCEVPSYFDMTPPDFPDEQLFEQIIFD